MAKRADNGRSSDKKALLVLVCLALAPYLLLPSKPFIADSVRAIRDNKVVQSQPLSELFRVDFWGVPTGANYGTNSYRPLVSLSYALQARLLGTHPQVFHLTDMLLHAGAVIVLWLLLRTWWPESTWSLPLASLFAVHPILSESICSMVGRADLMAGLAFLGALLLHARCGSGGTTKDRSGWIILLLAVALLSKEYAVAFPFLLIGIDLACAATGRCQAEHRRRARRVWIFSLVVLAGYLLLRTLLFGGLGGVPMITVAENPVADQPLLIRWSTATSLLLTAARLLLVPIGLTYHYGAGTLPVAHGPFDLRVLGGGALVALLLGYGIYRVRRDRQPWWLIAALVFLLPLAPALNTVSVAGVLFAERFLYLPAVGLILALAAAFSSVTQESLRRTLRTTIWVVVALLAVATALRVDDWRSNEALARASVAAYPKSAQGWLELGLALGPQGKAREAAAALRTSLETEPRRALVWKNLGVALLDLADEKGLPAEQRVTRFGEAATAWRKALELAPPDLGPLWRGLGQAELGARHPDEAVRALSRAHELMPGDENASLFLANALLQLAQKRFSEANAAEALPLAKRALALAKLPAEGYFLCGLLLARGGEPVEAGRAFAQAVEQDPEIVDRRHAQGVALSQAGKHDEAAQMFEQVLAAKPESVSTLFNLGRELILAGRPSEGMVYLRHGLAKRPDNLPARQMLAAAEIQARALSGASPRTIR